MVFCHLNVPEEKGLQQSEYWVGPREALDQAPEDLPRVLVHMLLRIHFICNLDKTLLCSEPSLSREGVELGDL